ncbi:hypothetical protein D3C81_1373420 [compost metagenome]
MQVILGPGGRLVTNLGGIPLQRPSAVLFQRQLEVARLIVELCCHIAMVGRAAGKLVPALQHDLTHLQVKTVVRTLGSAQYLILAILALAPLVSRASIKVCGAGAIQVIFAIVSPSYTAAVTDKVVRCQDTVLQNGIGVGGFHRWLVSTRVDHMRSNPRYHCTRSAAR